MRKPFRETEAWKWIRTALEMAGFALAVIAIILLFRGLGVAEGEYDVYVICKPGDYVNARIRPSKNAEVIGYFETGDRLTTDGTEKNGFIRIVDASLEADVAWISTAFVVEDRPEITERRAMVTSNARLAARKGVGGKVRTWLHNGDEVTVLVISDEWCVTNKGFVKTEFIELEGE